MSWPWNPGYGSLKVTGTDIDMSSYYRSIANTGISRTVSEINGDFGRKSQNFHTPVYFAPRCRGPPWNWVSALGIKKLEWWGYWDEKEVWRYLQPSGYNAPTWQTDTGRQHRPRWHIASRGKSNDVHRQHHWLHLLLTNAQLKHRPIHLFYDNLLNGTSIRSSSVVRPRQFKRSVYDIDSNPSNFVVNCRCTFSIQSVLSMFLEHGDRPHNCEQFSSIDRAHRMGIHTV